MRSCFAGSWTFTAVTLGFFFFAVTALHPAEGIFDNKVVLQLRIEIPSNAVEILRREPRQFVRAKVMEGGESWDDVGIHLKGGAGSFQSIQDKPSLTLSFNRLAPGKRFHGLKKIHLNNSVQDGSYLTENICGELYRRAGVPAARVSYAKVSINGKDKGLYVLKEGITKDFLGMYFTNRNGNLYDGGFLREITEPLERDTDAEDVKDWSDLKTLAEAAREQDLNKRFARMGEVLDMDRFLSFLVLQVLTWDWDGYVMNRNNYRVYHNLDTGKLVFLPHGMDQMFWEVNQRIIPEPDRFNALVARALMETPEGQRGYPKRFAEVFTNVFQIKLLTNRVDELSGLIRPHLGDDYTNHVNRIRYLIVAQHVNFEKQLRAKAKQ